MTSDKTLTRTGLTDDKARAFHAMGQHHGQRGGQTIFTLALPMDVLMWAWRPWFPAAFSSSDLGCVHLVPHLTAWRRLMVPNFFNEDWRFWQIVSPQEGLNAFLHALVWGAIVIHIVVIYTSDRYAAAWLG